MKTRPGAEKTVIRRRRDCRRAGGGGDDEALAPTRARANLAITLDTTIPTVDFSYCLLLPPRSRRVKLPRP